MSLRTLISTPSGAKTLGYSYLCAQIFKGESGAIYLYDQVIAYIDGAIGGDHVFPVDQEGAWKSISRHTDTAGAVVAAAFGTSRIKCYGVDEKHPIIQVTEGKAFLDSGSFRVDVSVRDKHNEINSCR
jgi:hypothetical protein